MIAGHFGLAAGVKAAARATPLWALMLATVWLDVVFVPLLLAGVETIGPAPGLEAGYGNAIIHADYTHSLIGAAVLSALFGWGGGALYGRRAGVVLGLVAFSHWLLDLLVHRADMPLVPANWGELPRLGLGLWQWPWLTASIEAVLILGGAWAYWTAAKGQPAVSNLGRARLVAWLIVAGGTATLALDFTGLLG